jgi:KDO2-lipid IV(A) lauroyltransferase
MRATLLHAVIALRTGAPIIPYCGIPQPDGRMVLELHPAIEIPPGATPADVAQKCWNFFESRIAEHPELWLWAYKHWRYRPRDAKRPYPFYANASKQFDRELKEKAAMSPGN